MRSLNRLLSGVLLICLALLTTAALSHKQPGYHPAADLVLTALIPPTFAQWQQLPDRYPVTPLATGAPYNQVLERRYRHSDGSGIMLSIAYGARQLGESLQAHRPESCYQAQGFTITQQHDTLLSLSDTQLPIRRLLAVRQQRHELISYWLIQGDRAVLPGISRLLAQWQDLLRGESHHGLVIRISSLDTHKPQAYLPHDRFIRDLLGSLPSAPRRQLAGLPVTTDKEQL